MRRASSFGRRVTGLILMPRATIAHPKQLSTTCMNFAEKKEEETTTTTTTTTTNTTTSGERQEFK
jgi:hypothetical protein